MLKLVLNGIEASPPVRSVLLTLNSLGLDYKFQEVDILKGENKSKEYIKKNPQHTIPVLEDNGQFLWDSHAIAAYLVRKYGKNDNLYPKDFYQRAVVDQRLHFDSGVLFSSLRNIVGPVLFRDETDIPQEKIDAVYEAYDFLEAFLQHDYMAGKNITIADFSTVSTTTSFAALAPIDPAKTPKLGAWIDRLSKLPYYENANAKGATVLTDLLKTKLGKN